MKTMPRTSFYCPLASARFVKLFKRITSPADKARFVELRQEMRHEMKCAFLARGVYSGEALRVRAAAHIRSAIAAHREAMNLAGIYPLQLELRI